MIGDSKYKVREKNYWFSRLGNISGNINYANQVINMSNIQTERCKEDTFFHEIAHGILKELEFNYPAITKYRNDELFTQELGLMLRKTFLDLIQKQGEQEFKKKVEDVIGKYYSANDEIYVVRNILGLIKKDLGLE